MKNLVNKLNRKFVTLAFLTALILPAMTACVDNPIEDPWNGGGGNGGGGCGDTTIVIDDPVGDSTNFGGVYYVPYGETVNLPLEMLEVKISKVISDTRCPYGVQCVQSGNAEVELEITEVGAKTQTVILNTDKEPNSLKLSKYTVSLNQLTPHPYLLEDGSIYHAKESEYAVILYTYPNK